MKIPVPEGINPDEFQLAIDKSREYFEHVTWDELRDQPTVDTHEKSLKIAEVIAVAGDEVEKKLGVCQKDWAKMLIMGGCAILAAIKYGEEQKESHRRSNLN